MSEIIIRLAEDQFEELKRALRGGDDDEYREVERVAAYADYLIREADKIGERMQLLWTLMYPPQVEPTPDPGVKLPRWASGMAF